MFWASTSLSFRDLGVNWGVNCVSEVSEVLVISALVFSGHRSTEPKVTRGEDADVEYIWQTGIRTPPAGHWGSCGSRRPPLSILSTG